MPSAELVDGRIVVAGVAYRDRDAIRELPGGRFSDGVWSCPAAWPALTVLLALFPGRMDVGDALKAWSWSMWEDHVKPTGDWREFAADVKNDCEGDERLYPYQRTGASYLVEAAGACLLDEPGGGKTAQVIFALEEADAFPALVVATTRGRSVWRREYEKWAPHRDVAVVGGSAAQRRKTLTEAHDVYVIGWGSLRLHTRLAPYGSTRLTDEEKRPKELNAIEWRGVVADEAHRAIHPKSKQTRALWAVGDRATTRIPLTGTPIADTPADFWSLLRFASPTEWPSRTKYIDRYCEVSYDSFGTVNVVGLRADTEPEFRRLTDHMWLRRPKKAMLPWLPEMTFETIDVDLPAKQRKAYDWLEEQMIADIDGGTLMALDQLTLATRLTQLASASLELDDGGGVRLCAPSSKVDALMELLEDEGDRPLVVAAQSRQLIMLAAARLEREKITHSLIVGAMTDRAADASEADFMEGRTRVMLLTNGAGSESLTLTRADTLVRLQRSWSLIENTQVVNRIHRPGLDSNKCRIIDFVAPDTVEGNQLDALGGKGDRLEEIVRDQRALRGALCR